MIKVDFYRRARLLSASEVKPGQIMEAHPGTKATLIYRTYSRVLKDPTNVLGYVVGELSQKYSQFFPNLTDRIRVRNITRLTHNIDKLRDYSSNERPFLVIGEIVQFSTFKGFNRYKKGAVKCDKKSEIAITQQLLSFIARREGKEYVFRTHKGETYSLSQILLTLSPKKKS